MDILVWILVAIVFLAIMGLGLSTFIEGIKKGAERIGIAPIVKNVTNSATQIAKNVSGDIVGKI